MRSLNLNMQTLWYVRSNGYVDVLDDDGFKTGDKEISYDGPTEINIALFPVNGDVILDSGGKFLEADFIATSNTIQLEKNDLLFKQLPVDNFDTTYDLLVKKILPSLNSYKYLIESRV